jgi:DNA-directed RNA polymerase subunit RPC12/RpoP
MHEQGSHPMKSEDEQGKPLKTEQRPCPKCGARLDFEPGAALKCPYCGFEKAIQQSATKVEELDYLSYLDEACQEKEVHEEQRVKCEKCGAQTTMPEETAAGICPFCGAGMVFSGSVSRLIKPEGILPFKIASKEALDSFRRWIGKRWFAPNGLKQYAQTENKLAGVYIPFWTYDSDAATSYFGERGDYYYTTETYETEENGRTVTNTREVRHTRWTPVSGSVNNNFDDILILASKSLPTKYTARLEPWDLANLTPYADDYLSGFRAESYQISLQQGFEVAKKIMEPAIASSIMRDIGGDEQQINSSQTNYGDITFKHVLLPVWLSAYRFRDKIYRILVNARTGEVQGERPYSAWKIAGAVVLGLLVIGIIILASSR